MSLISDDEKNELRKELQRIENEMHLHFFSSKNQQICIFCDQARELLTEVQELSDKIKLIEHEFETNPDLVKKFNIDKLPAIILTKTDDVNLGIRWFGIPAGYEFMSLIFALLDVGTGKIDIPDWALEKVKEINKPLHLQVFVTPTCPHCTNAVRIAHTLAFLNENVTADMVEASEFPDISEKYEVMAVPKVIINENHSFEGSLPFPQYIEKLLDAIK